jgi:myo-inositol catabolism protein IolS
MERLPEFGPIAFGCDPLGGHNWGDVDPVSVIAAIPHAIERGVKLFDTADCYGNGLSELRLAQALAEHRQSCLIATKFGVRIDAMGRTRIDNSAEWITKAVEGSLGRLGTDYIDLYQLHWWDKKTPFSAIFECLDRLVISGKIRAYGTTNATLEMMEMKTPSELPRACVSSSFEYSLANTAARDAIIAMCEPAAAVNFLAWGALGGGILTGKYSSSADLEAKDRRLKRPDSHFTGPRLSRNLEIVAKASEIANRHGDGIRPSQVALQWIRRNLGFGTCLVGIKSKKQINEAIDAFSFSLSDADINQLNLAADAPC